MMGLGHPLRDKKAVFQQPGAFSRLPVADSRLPIFPLTLLCALFLTTACELPPGQVAAPQQPAPITEPVEPAASTEPSPHHSPVNESRFIALGINTAEKAVQAVATLPPLDDLLTIREIRLHAALYREASRGIVAENTRSILLQPMMADQLPSLAIEPREFYLRVLAALASLHKPVAWTTIEPPAAGESEFFPDTHQLATRVSFEILSRNDAAATVTANISDTTAHTGSSRQRVIAIFDGRDWQTTRDGPRLIW